MQVCRCCLRVPGRSPGKPQQTASSLLGPAANPNGSPYLISFSRSDPVALLRTCSTACSLLLHNLLQSLESLPWRFRPQISERLSQDQMSMLRIYFTACSCSDACSLLWRILLHSLWNSCHACIMVDVQCTTVVSSKALQPSQAAVAACIPKQPA